HRPLAARGGRGGLPPVRAAERGQGRVPDVGDAARGRGSGEGMDRAKALDGVIVAEFATRAGGAFCGSLLAQLGATVIAVEPPGAEAEKALWRGQFAAGKLSFAPADNAADRALLESLAAVSDVVITSSDADPPLLRRPKADNPANVVCDITAFGDAGAMRG